MVVLSVKPFLKTETEWKDWFWRGGNTTSRLSYWELYRDLKCLLLAYWSVFGLKKSKLFF